MSEIAESMASLAEALRRSGYRFDEVVARINDSGQRALARNSTVAASRALGDAEDPQATLIRLWLLHQPVRRGAAEAALPPLQPLADAGLITVDRDRVRAALEVRPYASDGDPSGDAGAEGVDGWVVADLSPGLDALAPPMRTDFVLGTSPAAAQLAQLTMRTPVASALDLGTGCGVQSLHLARHCDRVTASDLNPRAIEMARLTFALNQLEVDLRHGDLYAPVRDERFDLIVTNPPYVIAPPEPATSRLTYRQGAMSGDELVATVVRQGADRLTDGGALQVLGNWAITDPDSWGERLEAWIPAGCDAVFSERERLDPYEYAEIWLADAGLLGAPDYLARYDAWIDYFDRLGITAVGLGWIAVFRNAHRGGGGTPRPTIRFEQWPHAVEQPVGPAYAAMRDGFVAARCSEPELMAIRWRLASDVVSESIATPGAEDPSHVVFRQQRGFRRGVEVDTALGGVLGACDGDLELGRIIDAVAALLEADAADLRADLAPRLRRLVADGFLITAVNRH